jgi:hypothetical protein
VAMLSPLEQIQAAAELLRQVRPSRRRTQCVNDRANQNPSQR